MIYTHNVRVKRDQIALWVVLTLLRAKNWSFSFFSFSSACITIRPLSFSLPLPLLSPSLPVTAWRLKRLHLHLWNERHSAPYSRQQVPLKWGLIDHKCSLSPSYTRAHTQTDTHAHLKSGFSVKTFWKIISNNWPSHLLVIEGWRQKEICNLFTLSESISSCVHASKSPTSWRCETQKSEWFEWFFGLKL